MHAPGELGHGSLKRGMQGPVLHCTQLASPESNSSAGQYGRPLRPGCNCVALAAEVKLGNAARWTAQEFAGASRIKAPFDGRSLHVEQRAL